MKRHSRFLPVVLLLAPYILATEVRADQVRLITSGFLNMEYQGNNEYGAEWSLRGPGITLLKSMGYDDGGASHCYWFPCTPGEIIDLTFEAGSEGYIKVDDIVCELDDPCFFGTYLMLSGKVRLPQNANPFTVTVPMSLSGKVSGFKCTLINEFGGCDEVEEVVAASLREEGTGTVIFDYFNGSEPYFNVRYTIKPIPEPTTMLLLGTGLVSIGGVLRRRRQDKGQYHQEGEKL